MCVYIFKITLISASQARILRLKLRLFLMLSSKENLAKIALNPMVNQLIPFGPDFLWVLGIISQILSTACFKSKNIPKFRLP